ncbi:fatty acyl-CoA hydrolase precursor, medium chain-like [Hemicordylus capensis]|uniref:fatty acyl-CoA hydrolase precursor, medium chain-like n=1 Tax=Hemicordylus capensis TaxID=884348 RepID=UPI002303C5CE|nr:fatty acyl-CoA hydrolase precursor, medium chain-like [Hemicordylus capensis]
MAASESAAAATPERSEVELVPWALYKSNWTHLQRLAATKAILGGLRETAALCPSLQSTLLPGCASCLPRSSILEAATGKMAWGLLLPLLLLAAWGPPLAAQGENPTPTEVLIKNGSLRGWQIKVSGAERNVDVFLGIPYAKPPLGSLRFSPPQPAEPWNGVRDATSYPPNCLQDPEIAQTLSEAFLNRSENVSLEISEDCLYLNIYSPAHSDKNATLPVMVWIHGGGLLIGAALTYDGSVLAAFEDVVVVAIQYRLGILGFFSTGDDVARGNWGLLDQVAALQWVQENIADFGGDPRSVTIFGQSAGGFSTSAHVLSPLSEGLFHRAISESGVALMKGLLDAHPGKLAEDIAQAAGCRPCSSLQMVECLRGKTEDEILQATLRMNFTKFYLDSDEKHFVFFPAVVDGIFFPEAPKDLLAERKINNVSCIIGVNNHEWGWSLPTFLQFPDVMEGLERETVNSVICSSEQFTGVAPGDAHIIASEYLTDDMDPLQLRDQLLDLLGDATFVAPAIQAAKFHRDAGYPAYVYEFQHPPSSAKGHRPDFVKADHTDEIGYVFGSVFLDSASEEEKELSRTMMKYWANFARNGNPNSDGLVCWPTFGQKEQYLEINLQQKVAKKLKEKQVAFWTECLPGKKTGK